MKSYRASIISERDEKGGPRTVSFRLLEGEKPERTWFKDGWGLFYARVKSGRNVVIRPGDRIRISCTRDWGHVSDLTLSLVKEIENITVFRVPRLPGISKENVTEWIGKALKLVLAEKKQVVIGVADPFSSTNTNDSWKGPDDLSGVAWVAHNGKSLFIHVLVRDHGALAPVEEGGAPWSADAIEIFLDMRERELIGKPQMSERVVQIYALPRGKGVLQRAPKGVSLELKILSPERYEATMEIPFKVFPGFAPIEGALFGFDIAIDDADPKNGEKPRRKAQIVWHGTANNFQDPRKYGRMCLE